MLIRLSVIIVKTNPAELSFCVNIDILFTDLIHKITNNFYSNFWKAVFIHLTIHSFLENVKNRNRKLLHERSPSRKQQILATN